MTTAKDQPTVTLFGREPVVAISLVVSVLIALLPLLGWTTEIVGSVSGALTILGGLVAAILTSRADQWLPLLVGAGQAVLAITAAFGLDLPDRYVTALVAVLTVIAGWQVRGQVTPARQSGTPLSVVLADDAHTQGTIRDAVARRAAQEREQASRGSYWHDDPTRGAKSDG